MCFQLQNPESFFIQLSGFRSFNVSLFFHLSCDQSVNQIHQDVECENYEDRVGDVLS